MADYENSSTMGLTLIDVSSEDDFLIESSLLDPINYQSSGVFDQEELFSTMGGNEKGGLHSLPDNRNDNNKSCDSLATMDGETLTLGCLEADLFDLRASIQKSNRTKDLKTEDAQDSNKVELATQDKLKQKVYPKKPSIGLKDSGVTSKQVSVRPKPLHSVARSGESTPSLHKPPMAINRVSTVSTTPSKRFSLVAKNVKMQKDANSMIVRGTIMSKTTTGGLRDTVPKPTSSKSSSCFPSSTRTSRSSFESCTSASSSRVTKSALNSVKQKEESIRTNPSFSGRTVTTPSRATLKGKNQVGSSKLSTFLKSSTKHSSNLSPASSISQWSSKSISSVTQKSNIVKSSLDTGSHKGLGTNRKAHQVMDAHNHPSDQGLMGDVADINNLPDEKVNNFPNGSSGLLHPASMKPSGLRTASPKIGSFDGVRSSGCTRNGSMLRRPSVPTALPKTGAKSFSPIGSSNKAKIGKPQPARSLNAIRSPKIDVKQSSSAVKSRS